MTDRELLAMMVYKFARYHHDLQNDMEKAVSLADDCLAGVDDCLDGL